MRLTYLTVPVWEAVVKYERRDRSRPLSAALGLIFEKAQNRIQDPVTLRRLIVELIGREQWSPMAAAVKGDAGEG